MGTIVDTRFFVYNMQDMTWKNKNTESYHSWRFREGRIRNLPKNNPEIVETRTSPHDICAVPVSTGQASRMVDTRSSGTTRP